MKIIFLGTGTGIPEKNNSSSSTLIKSENKLLLFDIGHGTLRQLARKGIEITEIDALFITHTHIDHISDLLPLLFAFKYPVKPRKKDFYIFGSKTTIKKLNKLITLFNEQLKTDNYSLKLNSIEKKNINFGNIILKSFKTFHSYESVGFEIEKGNKKIILTGDTEFREELLKYFKKADILIIECSFPIKVDGHINPDDVNEILKRGKTIKKIAINHRYPVIKKEDILKKIDKKYIKKVIIPYELMELSI